MLFSLSPIRVVRRRAQVVCSKLKSTLNKHTVIIIIRHVCGVCNLNVHYLVIFKNPRDNTVIDYLARQAFPSNRNYLIEAFKDATVDRPNGYLFLDFTQACPDILRVISDIFNPYGIIVYKQGNVQ